MRIGTNQNDGMALFSGLLSFFADKNIRLLAITHMYEVFRRQLITENRFKFSHMKVLPDKSGLCYLYRLADGLGEEQSFAIECARESGITEEILNRGKGDYVGALFIDILAKGILLELRQGASPEDLKLKMDDSNDLTEAINLITSIVNLN